MMIRVFSVGNSLINNRRTCQNIIRIETGNQHEIKLT
jgi:hypothetical protein